MPRLRVRRSVPSLPACTGRVPRGTAERCQCDLSYHLELATLSALLPLLGSPTRLHASLIETNRCKLAGPVQMVHTTFSRERASAERLPNHKSRTPLSSFGHFPIASQKCPSTPFTVYPATLCASAPIPQCLPATTVLCVQRTRIQMKIAGANWRRRWSSQCRRFRCVFSRFVCPATCRHVR